MHIVVNNLTFAVLYNFIFMYFYLYFAECDKAKRVGGVSLEMPDFLLIASSL